MVGPHAWHAEAGCYLGVGRGAPSNASGSGPEDQGVLHLGKFAKIGDPNIAPEIVGSLL